MSVAAVSSGRCLRETGFVNESRTSNDPWQQLGRWTCMKTCSGGVYLDKRIPDIFDW
jgi:hypothetical protein